jgi:6-phosphogluconolactonase
MPETPENEHRHIDICLDLDAVAHAGADLFVEMCQAVSSSGFFTVALSGGGTPKALNRLLSAPPYIDQVDWNRVQFFWGDERFVPPGDPESNYRMAEETLLAHLPVDPAQIHRIHTELDNPEAAASEYEEELRAAFQLATGQLPQFDLVFLGMGPDGHTASLFPHTAALAVTDRLAVANYIPKLASYRITLTVPVINNAAVVAFLASGADKASALAAVLEGPHDPDQFPAQKIAPVDGDLYWLVDHAAAAGLQRLTGDDTNEE